MVEILSRKEELPTSYPPVFSELSAEATALEWAVIWQRIEAYTAHRWTLRTVTWVVQGPGGWSPDLAPVTLETAESWQSGAWTPVTLELSPLGGWILPGAGLFRFVGTVGGGSVPEAVSEAFRRLAEYSAEDPGRHGASSNKVGLGPIAEEYTRSPTWLARAMQNSGAGDLLRPYRRV